MPSLGERIRTAAPSRDVSLGAVLIGALKPQPFWGVFFVRECQGHTGGTESIRGTSVPPFSPELVLGLFFAWGLTGLQPPKVPQGATLPRLSKGYQV